MIPLYAAEYGLNLQSCFEETDRVEKRRWRVEEVKSTILSMYNVPVSFHLNSQLKGIKNINIFIITLSLRIIYSSSFFLFLSCSDISPIELYSCLKTVLSTSAVKKLCEL